MAITNEDLINNYSILHETGIYGDSASKFSDQIQCCINELNPGSILEYGCGQSKLDKLLEFGESRFFKYDPAIPEYQLNHLACSDADFIINTDVMEHVPESDILDVLHHIRSFGSHVYFNISTRIASTVLADGRNAHCTVKNTKDWLTQISSIFPESELCGEYDEGSCVIVTWKCKSKSIISRLIANENELISSRKRESLIWKLRRKISARKKD